MLRNKSPFSQKFRLYFINYVHIGYIYKEVEERSWSDRHLYSTVGISVVEFGFHINDVAGEAVTSNFLREESFALPYRSTRKGHIAKFRHE